MRMIIAVLVLVALIGCSSVPEDAHVCTDHEKDTDMCTMEYAPVCGNDGETYGNGCSACSSGNIEFYIEGEC